MNFKNLSLTTLLVSATIMGASLSSCSKKQETAGQAPAPSLKVLTVDESSSTLYKSLPATIKGKTDVDIRPLVSGNITNVHVEEGQFVRKGQPLFTLDQVSYQAAVDQAQASVNAAATAVATAQINADNQKALYDRNIISQNAWQVADNQLQQAKAQLKQSQAALTSARNQLSYTIVKAPSDGFVGTIPFREGALASPSMAVPLTTVSDNSEIYAYIALNQDDMLEMTDAGTKNLNSALSQIPAVNLILSNGEKYPFEGKISTISGVVDNSTGAASVRVLFPNPSGMLRSGYTGQVQIPVNAENSILIPQKATYEMQDLRYVFTLNDSNITVPTQIEVLNLNDGKNYVVTSGLKPGDRIVIEGIGTAVRAGMPINPVDANAAESAPEAAQE
ncbi:MAG: efflux RND transporter periplasmic adaptor subunit [Odoribacter sp.]|nr:efflux RND transporter periplasmic adaptor subunit [Odoribacter sp.]